ncbi:MAG: type II secretion system F family protein [Calditrichaceae bacterium]
MPNFKYKAMNHDGRQIENIIQAADENDAIRQLQKQNLIPVAVRLEKTVTKKTSKKIKIKNATILLFTEQLYTLLKAGIPIVSSLNVIRRQSPDPDYQGMIDEIISDINEGSSFSAALDKFSGVFSRIYVNSVKVGEISGALEDTLLYLHKFLEQEGRIREEITKAVRYPIMVLMGLVGAFIITMTTVIPNFIPLFERSQHELPLPTRILIGINTLFTDYGLLTLTVVVLLGVGFYFYAKTEGGRYNKSKLALNVPVFGRLLRHYYHSRFARLFLTMNRTGIPILRSFEMIQETLENEVYRKVLRKVTDSIVRGEEIARALGKSAYFDVLLIEMVSIGEKSGSLDQMLQSASQYYDNEVSKTVGNLTSLIEPIVTLVLGIMVLILALAIFLPMWDLMDVF